MKISYLSQILFVICLLSVASSAQIVLNELDVNPGGTDNPCEYVELKGPPSGLIQDLYFVSLEGDIGSTPGVATALIGFGNPGVPLGSNGLAVVVGTQACGARTYPAATAVYPVALLDTASGALQNGTNSFLLISSPTALLAGADYDTNNDGTLDNLPPGAVVVDGVAWSDGGAGDLTYGTVVLSATGGTVGAATRFPNNTTANSAAAWYAGAMVGLNSDTTYSATVRSTNFPPDGVLTPGAPNIGTAVALDAPIDFNGDGKTDFVVTRDTNTPGVGITQKYWYTNLNGTNTNSVFAWGLQGDELVPEDYDGDGKDDIAVWRRSGTSSPATFYIFQSQTGTVRVDSFGIDSDDVGVVGDYDGDGKADPATYRCPTGSPGQCTFFYRGSLNNPSGNITYFPWGSGTSATVVPAPGDFDGDGKFDFCIRRDVGGGAAQFILRRSTDGGIEYINWGLTTDAIIPGDFDGDAKSDFCVVRFVGNQGQWYILERDGGGTGASPIVFGDPTQDFGAWGDYDGDGKTDLAVWRPNADPSMCFFYVRQSTNGALLVKEWGQNGDQPAAEWNGGGGPPFAPSK